MKQIASLSAFLLLIGMPILGQPFIFINEPGEEIAYDILEFKDYYIISCTEYTQTNYNSYLIKLGHDGTIIDDTVIGSGLKSLKLYEFNDNIYIFSLQFNDSIDKGYLSFICMDTMFNRSIQKSLFVHPAIYSPDLFDVILTSDSLFLIVGNALDTGFQYPQNNRSFFLYQVSLLGDSINSTYYSGPYSNFRSCEDIIERDSDYIAFANNIVQEAVGSVLVISKDLIIQDTINLENDLKHYYSPLVFGDSYYVISTRRLTTNHTMYISKLNSNFQITKSIPVGKSNSLCFPAWLISLTLFDGRIYFLGAEDLSFTNLLYGTGKPNNLIVMRLDDNLNTIWTRTLGGDYYYFPTTIKATSDGGCILIGTINDTLNYMNTTTDIFVFKLDSNGQITYISNISPGEPFVSVFPNPASQELNIQKSDGSDAIITVEIYSLSGALVKSLDSNSNVLTIDISDLADGTYLINGLTKSGKQFQKKFIKM